MKVKTFELCLLFSLLLGGSLSAQPAPLDSAFGLNGIVQFPYGFSNNLRDMELLPDGKILLAGGTTDSVYLARFRADGSLDPGFGTQGILPFFSDTVGYHNDLIQLPDGKFISIGQSQDFASPFQTPLFAVARLHADGSLDPTFGQSGITTTRFGNFGAFSQFGALQSDGKILAVGQAYESGLHYAWARYHPDGKIDSSFSENGITILPTAGTGVPSCIAILPDGKILTGGTEVGGNPYARFLLCRLLPNGNLDPAFGINGVFSQWFGHYYETISGLAVLPDGKILLAGWVGENTDGEFALLRLEANGTPDMTFGNGGLKTFSLGHENILTQIDALQNGEFIASGTFTETSSTGSVAPYQAVVFRFLADGTLDTRFNGTGTGALRIGAAAGLSGQIIQPDGKVLTGGFFYETDTTPPHIFLARVLNENLNATTVPAGLEHISVSPNPTTGLAVLQFTIARATTLRIMLLDAAQGCIKALQPAAWTPAGTHTRSFDISQLPAGTYYVALEGAGGVSVLSLIKL